MARLTLKIVAKALFSADVSDDAGAIGAALTEVNRQLGEFSLLDMFWMIPTPRKRRFRAAVRALDQRGRQDHRAAPPLGASQPGLALDAARGGGRRDQTRG